MEKQENQSIKTKKILIEKNAIQFNRTTLQISSISHISLHTPPNRSMVKPIIAFAVFLLFLSTSKLVSLLGMAISGYIIYRIKESNDNKGENIFIHLNSGQSYIINCTDKEFADYIREVIEYCINNSHSDRVVINMEKCDIANSPLMFGDRGEVSYGD